MWDEEGMEALADSGHPCGSFDSDLNSMVSPKLYELIDLSNLQERSNRFFINIFIISGLLSFIILSIFSKCFW